MQVYENQLNNQILKYERDLMMLTNQDVSISQLGSHKDMMSYFAAVNLKQYLEEIRLFDDSFDWLSVAEQTSGIVVAVASEELGYHNYLIKSKGRGGKRLTHRKGGTGNLQMGGAVFLLITCRAAY